MKKTNEMVNAKMMRRMNKEVCLLKDKYGASNVNNYPGEDEHDVFVLSLTLTTPYKFNYIVHVDIHYDYPFTSPDVFLISKDKTSRTLYFEFFKRCSEFYIRDNPFPEHECPCCYNMICRRELNTPIVEIIQDIEHYDKQLVRLRSRYYATKYLYKTNRMDADIFNIVFSYL